MASLKFVLSLIGCSLICISTMVGQEHKNRNTKIQLPDIPGYITLKGDFHLHTVFSDGHVWPTFRVREAQRDGLDVISLTEHIDYEGFPNEIEYNREEAFKIAQKRAEKTDVLVIRGVEISPRVPPYHNNALFLKNVDKLPYDYMKDTQSTFVMKDDIQRTELMAPFLEVEKQGGFVFYNHPSYNWWDKKDKELFTDIHEELLSKGILGGVEVVNSGRYNLIAHRMAEKYNLTLIGNSDAHYEIEGAYEKHRPMTLIFATEKTESAIKEALLNRRTMVYFDDYLIGRQREAEAFFKAAIEVVAEKITTAKAPKLKVSITNNSDVPFALTCSTDYIATNMPLGKLIVDAHTTASFELFPVWEYPEKLHIKTQVENILVSPEQALQTEIIADLK